MGLNHMNWMHIASVASESTIIEVPAWILIFSGDLDQRVGTFRQGSQQPLFGLSRFKTRSATEAHKPLNST